MTTDETEPTLPNEHDSLAWTLANSAPHIQLEYTGVTPHQQTELLDSPEFHHKAAIAAKLFQTSRPDLAETLSRCHTQESFAQCQGCGKLRHWWNRCDRIYCPVCQPRLAHVRRDSIGWWTQKITQPKHVVLTVRNRHNITRDWLVGLKLAVGKLRRQKVFRSVTGGMYSLEITNEGKGWHVHFHLLVNAKWIDSGLLATTWGALVGQDYAIVKVKDCRKTEYLREVSKYAVKGSQLASWTGEDIATFIDAIRGLRTFGVFGTLFKERSEWNRVLQDLSKLATNCDCGCAHWKLFTGLEWEAHCAIHGPGLHPFTPRPPPVAIPDPQMQIPSLN